MGRSQSGVGALLRVRSSWPLGVSGAASGSSGCRSCAVFSLAIVILQPLQLQGHIDPSVIVHRPERGPAAPVDLTREGPAHPLRRPRDRHPVSPAHEVPVLAAVHQVQAQEAALRQVVEVLRHLQLWHLRARCPDLGSEPPRRRADVALIQRQAPQGVVQARRSVGEGGLRVVGQVAGMDGALTGHGL